MSPTLAAAVQVQFCAAFPQTVITVSEEPSYHLRELLVAARLNLALRFDSIRYHRRS